MVNFILDPNLHPKPGYTPGTTLKEYQEQCGVETILDLASNVNPLGPSQKAIQAVRQASQHIHTYPGAELSQLRSKLAESIGPNLSEENIIVGNGSCDVLRMAAEVFLFGGGEGIMRRNAFPMYEVVTKRYGGECVFVETNWDYSFEILSLAEKITDRTKLIYLANPHNPTGRIITQSDLDEFMKHIPASVIVVFDHACQEYVEEKDFPDLSKYILDGHNIIMTRTFSKMYALAGLRIGYGVARKEIIDLLRRTKIPFYDNTASLMAASAALDDVEHVEFSRTVNQEGKKYLYQQFDQLGLSYVPTQSSSILLVDLKHDTEAISQVMLRQGVLVLPAHPYNFPHAIRITIGRPEENQRLLGALIHALEEMDGVTIC
ncbi:MAG: aminotransferase class I/II-fold pyridoxal phosphate-dependent enzyme [Anaerolineaceae bacterium]|nr:aminotransferase class I/II-fold pyridoxal phosphate-dependent enzyme [Anaerolineaceae bacterium]